MERFPPQARRPAGHRRELPGGQGEFVKIRERCFWCGKFEFIKCYQVEWTKQLVAEQQKKTIKIKKDTEKMKAISDAEREKEVKNNLYLRLSFQTS